MVESNTRVIGLAHQAGGMHAWMTDPTPAPRSRQEALQSQEGEDSRVIQTPKAFPFSRLREKSLPRT